jgi:hypothetical protein
MKIYKEITDELTGIQVIQLEEDEKISWIPTDPANSDYQAYLFSISEGSETTTEEGDK